MSRLGPHQRALLALALPDLLGPAATIREERNSKGRLSRAVVSGEKARANIPADSVRRLVRRGLYEAGRVTDAGRAAYEEWMTKGRRR